jgi:hypothetical protein
MKQVFYVPMSANTTDNEKEINFAITKLEHDFKLEWLTDLIKATDANKYMLVYEKSEGSGSASPSIGVKVIQGSQDMVKTEKIINDALLEMELDEDKNFLSICNPAEFMYIILYENKSGNLPRVKIINNPSDVKAASRRISMFLQQLDDDPEWKLEPFDSFMLNKNHNMMILFSSTR